MKTRRALLRHVKTEVKKRLGSSEPDDITEFTHRYEKELRKTWKVSSQKELLERVLESNLVYGGDFHALEQAQRTHLRVLRSLPAETEVVLALECFQTSAQKHLDGFLRGDLSLDELRANSRWDRTWGFSFDHYRPLLELARVRGFRLLALNSPRRSSLAVREAAAARVLARECARTPALIYVLFGDLHLAPAHLPGRVRAALRRPRRELTIHLNSERVYFQLAAQGREVDVDVVKFGESSFCILSTPPWVKWQSYLLFLDRGGVADADARLDDETDFDPTDQVALLVRLAAGDLGLRREFGQINDLAVYSEHDEAIWRAVDSRLGDGDREIAHSLLRARVRFFIPSGGIAYQPKPTINAAASLAGFYLHARLSRRRKVLWKFPDEMRALIWTEAVSHFISKMINHSRRGETLSGLQTKLRSKSSNPEALRLALDIRLSEMARLQMGRARPLQIKPRRRSSAVEAARILGGMLGERLYECERTRKLKRDTLVEWLRFDPGSRGFPAIYDGIVEQLMTWT